MTESLNRGRQIPLSALRVVDATEFGQLLERMRINVPSSIMESERTLAERDRILADAHAEYDRILQQARQKAMELLSEDAIVVAARHEAERITEDSRNAAKRRAEEADRYAVQVLEDLAQKLQVITKQVENGVQLMRTGRFIDSTDYNEPTEREDH
ncbi:MAG: hypothetical protein NT075_08755 [Chloroflexi bacterium]|nr:hypothetical protein [Chloroflexota bacterium]